MNIDFNTISGVSSITYSVESDNIKVISSKGWINASANTESKTIDISVGENDTKFSRNGTVSLLVNGIECYKCNVHQAFKRIGKKTVYTYGSGSTIIGACDTTAVISNVPYTSTTKYDNFTEEPIVGITSLTINNIDINDSNDTRTISSSITINDAEFQFEITQQAGPCGGCGKSTTEYTYGSGSTSIKACDTFATITHVPYSATTKYKNCESKTITGETQFTITNISPNTATSENIITSSITINNAVFNFKITQEASEYTYKYDFNGLHVPSCKETYKFDEVPYKTYICDEYISSGTSEVTVSGDINCYVDTKWVNIIDGIEYKIDVDSSEGEDCGCQKICEDCKNYIQWGDYGECNNGVKTRTGTSYTCECIKGECICETATTSETASCGCNQTNFTIKYEDITLPCSGHSGVYYVKYSATTKYDNCDDKTVIDYKEFFINVDCYDEEGTRTIDSNFPFTIKQTGGNVFCCSGQMPNCGWRGTDNGIDECSIDPLVECWGSDDSQTCYTTDSIYIKGITCSGETITSPAWKVKVFWDLYSPNENEDSGVSQNKEKTSDNEACTFSYSSDNGGLCDIGVIKAEYSRNDSSYVRKASIILNAPQGINYFPKEGEEGYCSYIPHPGERIASAWTFSVWQAPKGYYWCNPIDNSVEPSLLSCDNMSGCNGRAKRCCDNNECYSYKTVYTYADLEDTIPCSGTNEFTIEKHPYTATTSYKNDSGICETTTTVTGTSAVTIGAISKNPQSTDLVIQESPFKIIQKGCGDGGGTPPITTDDEISAYTKIFTTSSVLNKSIEVNSNTWTLLDNLYNFATIENINETINVVGGDSAYFVNYTNNEIEESLKRDIVVSWVMALALTEITWEDRNTLLKAAYNAYNTDKAFYAYKSSSCPFLLRTIGAVLYSRYRGLNEATIDTLISNCRTEMGSTLDTQTDLKVYYNNSGEIYYMKLDQENAGDIYPNFTEFLPDAKLINGTWTYDDYFPVKPYTDSTYINTDDGKIGYINRYNEDNEITQYVLDNFDFHYNKNLIGTDGEKRGWQAINDMTLSPSFIAYILKRALNGETSALDGSDYESQARDYKNITDADWKYDVIYVLLEYCNYAGNDGRDGFVWDPPRVRPGSFTPPYYENNNPAFHLSSTQDHSLCDCVLRSIYDNNRCTGTYNNSTYDCSERDKTVWNGSLPFNSYPSGHASYSFMDVCLLIELYPHKWKYILKRGWDFSQNRVVVRWHWQSDVIIGRLVGGCVVPRLHTFEKFQSLFNVVKTSIKQSNPSGYYKNIYDSYNDTDNICPWGTLDSNDNTNNEDIKVNIKIINNSTSSILLNGEIMFYLANPDSGGNYYGTWDDGSPYTGCYNSYPDSGHLKLLNEMERLRLNPGTDEIFENVVLSGSSAWKANRYFASIYCLGDNHGNNVKLYQNAADGNGAISNNITIEPLDTNIPITNRMTINVEITDYKLNINVET